MLTVRSPAVPRNSHLKCQRPVCREGGGRRILGRHRTPGLTGLSNQSPPGSHRAAREPPGGFNLPPPVFTALFPVCRLTSGIEPFIGRPGRIDPRFTGHAAAAFTFHYASCRVMAPRHGEAPRPGKDDKYGRSGAPGPPPPQVSAGRRASCGSTARFSTRSTGVAARWHGRALHSVMCGGIFRAVRRLRRLAEFIFLALGRPLPAEQRQRGAGWRGYRVHGYRREGVSWPRPLA